MPILDMKRFSIQYVAAICSGSRKELLRCLFVFIASWRAHNSFVWHPLTYPLTLSFSFCFCISSELYLLIPIVQLLCKHGWDGMNQKQAFARGTSFSSRLKEHACGRAEVASAGDVGVVVMTFVRGRDSEKTLS